MNARSPLSKCLIPNVKYARFFANHDIASDLDFPLDICEAQSAVNQLTAILFGSTIVKVTVAPWYRTARDAAPLLSLTGWTFTGVSRRGKSILFEFENFPLKNLFLLSRATGHWLLSASEKPNTVVTFLLSSSHGVMRLAYIDEKRLGTLETAHAERDFEALRALGPDLLSDQFSASWVLASAQRHKAPIHALLLRPEYFPGVGNWTATEALFRASLSPAMPAQALTDTQAQRLASALIRTVLNGIAKGGYSTRSCNPDGSYGTAKEDFAVFRRAGKSCLVCRKPVQKIKVLKKSTFYCKSCQCGIEPKPVSVEFVEQVVKATEGSNGRDRPIGS